MALHTSPASDSTDPATASLNSMLRRCQIEVKYVEAVAGSVESDAGDVWSASRGAKTLHEDTAKLPRGTFYCHAGVFFASLSRGINACEYDVVFMLIMLLLY